jgi:hypothetical protein
MGSKNTVLKGVSDVLYYVEIYQLAGNQHNVEVYSRLHISHHEDTDAISFR